MVAFKAAKVRSWRMNSYLTNITWKPSWGQDSTVLSFTAKIDLLGISQTHLPLDLELLLFGKKCSWYAGVYHTVLSWDFVLLFSYRSDRKKDSDPVDSGDMLSSVKILTWLIIMSKNRNLFFMSLEVDYGKI